MECYEEAWMILAPHWEIAGIQKTENRIQNGQRLRRMGDAKPSKLFSRF
jgi:hypothetical protein